MAKITSQHIQLLFLLYKSTFETNIEAEISEILEYFKNESEV